MKNYKVILTIFLASLLLMFLISPLRGYVNHMTSSLVGFIAYFLLTIYFIAKFRSRLKESWIVIAILTGLCILQLPVRIFDFHATLITLPDFLMHILGIFVGFIYCKSNRIIGVTVSLVALSFVLFMFFKGYERWGHYVSFGTLFYTVSEKVPDFTMIDSNGNEFTNRELKGKIVVFDFWGTACGVCFKKFPILQEKFTKYRNIPGIEFYAVNLPIKRDSIGDAEKIIRGYHYTFPLLVAQNDSLAKRFKVFAIPTVIIIRNGEEIIYRGNIEGIDEIIEKYGKQTPTKELTNVGFWKHN